MGAPRRAGGRASSGLVVLALLLAGCGPEPFEPQGAEASAGRTAARTALAALLDDVARGRTVLGRATLDGCVTGQDSWKRQDEYAHECTVSDSAVVAVADRADRVGPGLLAVDDLLRGLGCEPTTWGGLDRVQREYWRDGDPVAEPADAAALPAADYTCGGEVSVEVRPTSAGARGDPRAALGPVSEPDDLLSGGPHDAATLTALRSSGLALAVVVTASRTYYRTRF